VEKRKEEIERHFLSAPIYLSKREKGHERSRERGRNLVTQAVIIQEKGGRKKKEDEAAAFSLFPVQEGNNLRRETRK